LGIVGLKFFCKARLGFLSQLLGLKPNQRSRAYFVTAKCGKKFTTEWQEGTVLLNAYRYFAQRLTASMACRLARELCQQA